MTLQKLPVLSVSYLLGAGLVLMLMPAWLSATLLTLSFITCLGVLAHRHWQTVCYSCRVMSEFMAFCLLVVAFAGLVLGLNTMVDLPQG